MKPQRFNLPGRNIISETEAVELLTPHFDRLFLCAKEAWDSWEQLGKVAPELRKAMDTTARANFVSSHFRENVRKRFKGIAGVSICEKERLFALDIEGLVLLRFKKLDRAFRSRNIPTHQQMELQMQLQATQVQLPNFPDEATWLTCGYVLNFHQTGIEKYVVTCSLGRQVKYIIPLMADNIIESPIEVVQQVGKKAQVLPKVHKKTGEG